MSDIVEKLRELATWSYSQDFDFITEGDWFTKAADEIERLRAALAAGEARPEPVPVYGPWHARRLSEHRWCVQSDDLEHGAALRLFGTFFTDETRGAYAHEIARRLNAAPPQPAEPSGLLALVRECIADLDEPHDDGHPDHDHAVPGHWDVDGTECVECVRWRKMRAALRVGSGGSK